MTIREATHNDIPEILKVLKASLGETSSRKNEEIWRYKHINNPFGKSLVLVAEENSKLLGVRAFMRWQWQKGDELFSAFRAVDTATHPEHQGKGIFKKLTLQALEIGKENGDHFVFNTPNSQSKPGYLKMGWKSLGRVKIRVRMTNPRIWSSKSKKIEKSYGRLEILEKTLDSWNQRMQRSDKFFTQKSSDYLDWRYLKNPLLDYYVDMSEDCFFAGHIKEHSKVRELRISELIFDSDMKKKEVKKKVLELAKQSGANVITYSGNINYHLFHSEMTAGIGPELTFKALANINPDLFDQISWAYSLGDLELF